jgi:hypothetical protein
MTDTGALAALRAGRRRTLRAASERHVNYMLKKTEPGSEKSGFFREQVPGLTLLSSVGAAVRGCFALGDRAWFVAGDTLYELFSGMTYTARGTLQTSSGRVEMDQGLFSLMAVDGPHGYVLNLSDNDFGQITDPDFYGSDRVSFLDGKFVLKRPDTQQFYWSEGVDGATSYDALDFASAESSPDNIVGHITDHRELWFLGTDGGEVWYPSPGTDQVYARNNGASIEVGLSAAHTLQQVDNSIAWVGRDRNGQGIVWLAGGSNGYIPIRISSNEVEEAIEKVADLSDAYAWVYQDAGQTFYVLQVPGVETTWVWDASTRKWHERADFSAGELQRSRADCHMFAHGRHIIGGSDGGLYELDPWANLNGSDVLYREWTTPHSAVPDRKRVFFHSLRLDTTTGQTTSGVSPRIEMCYSNDGGENFGAWKSRSTGAIGVFAPRTEWHMLGSAKDRVWKFRTTANAKVSIIGLAVKAQEGQS